jgi:hypothetical protein
MTKSAIVIESVINGYLNGKSFDEISYENNIAKGSAFNIVNSWITHIGIPDIKELRAFSIMVRKSGITIKQCAQGFRFIQILANFGIKDELDNTKYTTDSISGNTDKNDRNYPASRESFYYFIENIYNYCKNTDIKSTNIIGWMQDLINFASLFSKNGGYNTVKLDENVTESNKFQHPDNNNKYLFGESVETSNKLPLISEMSDYIEQKKLEGQHLHTNNKKLQREIDSLEEQKNALLARTTNLKERESILLTYLDWYNSLKNALWNSHGIRLEQEVSSFVKTLNDFKFYNYNAHKIIREYKQMEALRVEIEALQGIVGSIKKTRDETLEELRSLEERENYSRQSLDTLLELSYSGFGFKELKQLKNTIMEIAVSNDISTYKAGKKFCKDVENQYDSKLGFETTINEIKTEREKLENEMPGYKDYLQLKVFMIGSLLYLHKFGVTDDDIISMTHIVTAYLNGNISFDPNLSSKNIVDENKLIRKAHYWKLFIDEIRNLGDINSQIKNQRSHLEEIKKEIDDLNSQRQKLNEQTLLSAQLLNALNAKLSSFIEFTKEAVSSIKDKNKIIIVYQPLFIINVITRDDLQDDDNTNPNDKSP